MLDHFLVRRLTLLRQEYGPVAPLALPWIAFAEKQGEYILTKNTVQVAMMVSTIRP